VMERTTNRRHLVGLITGAMVAVAISFTATAAAAGPVAPPPGEDQRIDFAPGADSATVQGTVAVGFNDRYVLRAAAGQTMTVTVDSPENLAIARVFGPEDAVQHPSDTGELTIRLPADGDYVVEVSTIRGVSDYTVTFRITDSPPPPLPPPPVGTIERIEFAPGTNNASVTGAVVRGTSDGYVLRAEAGQTMIVHIDSVEGNAAFHVYAPDGATLAVEQQQLTIQLPASGDYVIEVVSVRGNTTYQMSVWID
jgi:hypothetical protein